MFNPIRIPVSLSPHIVNGKPRGYYVLAERLFAKNKNPHLVRNQFVGVAKSLVISVSHNSTWDTLLEMSISIPHLPSAPQRANRVYWLDKAKLYPINMGFRAYVPGSVLKPEPDAEKIETMGEFKRFQMGTTDLFYLEIPIITLDILLGKEKL